MHWLVDHGWAAPDVFFSRSIEVGCNVAPGQNRLTLCIKSLSQQNTPATSVLPPADEAGRAGQNAQILLIQTSNGNNGGSATIQSEPVVQRDVTAILLPGLPITSFLGVRPLFPKIMRSFAFQDADEQ